jgi:hypothetical protein
MTMTRPSRTHRPRNSNRSDILRPNGLYRLPRSRAHRIGRRVPRRRCRWRREETHAKRGSGEHLRDAGAGAQRRCEWG